MNSQIQIRVLLGLKRVSSLDQKVYYQKYTQIISKSRQFESKKSVEIAQKYDKSLIQKIRSQKIQEGEKEFNMEYGPFFLIPTYQAGVPVIMYQPWHSGVEYRAN